MEARLIEVDMAGHLQGANRYIVMTIPYFILMKRFGYDGGLRQ